MKKLILLAGSFLLLAACDNNEATRTVEEVPLHVELHAPDNIKTGDTALIQATIKQGPVKVKDVDAVTFEIQQSGKKNRIELEGKKKANGVYYTRKTFLKNGTYRVIAHVGARDMYSKPETTILVYNQAANIN
jgi:hypothetical protein